MHTEAWDFLRHDRKEGSRFAPGLGSPGEDRNQDKRHGIPFE